MSKSNDTTTVQKADPWKQQQPYLMDIFNNAQAQFYGLQPQFYPDPITAPYAPQEQLGQSMLEGYALGNAQTQANNAQAAQAFSLGPAMYADSNPYLRSAAQGAIDPVREMLMQEILPGIRHGAVQMGQYGGTRQDLASASAVDKAIEDMLNTTAGMYSHGYDSGLENMSRALALAPQTMQLGTQPMQYLATSGAMDRDMHQAMLDEQIRRWNFAQQTPSAQLVDYQQLIQGQYGGTSTSLLDSGGNDLTQALGAGIAGYSGGAWLANQYPSLGWTPSTAGNIGAGLSVLMSLF